MKRLFTVLVIIMLSLIVSANTYISQQYPEAFYAIVYRKDVATAYAVLDGLRGTRLYNKQLPILSKIVDSNLSEHFESRDKIQKTRISRLRSLLEKNPNNPQLLTAIAFEYKKGAQDVEAEEYYSQARLIDPFIYVPGLEK